MATFRWPFFIYQTLTLLFQHSGKGARFEICDH